jgi:hypothetical protein
MHERRWLAFLWAAGAQQLRKEASATLLSIELIDAAENDFLAFRSE